MSFFRHMQIIFPAIDESIKLKRAILKSAYLNLTSGGQIVIGRSGEEVSILAKVWKSWAPLKVMVFSWQLLQDRISTRVNLFRWLGWEVVMPRDLLGHYDAFLGFEAGWRSSSLW
ncbi:hypothetical protein A2U01_0013027 [Trifolium medium]|uniref:Reverse transcriptase zinc-binding domain-containing protein n=1 Tax=Trifolium medium TaxID=97028 RepID=A0A392N0S9_9FABA|nr:hypothetical protein [Trifolium medium]